MLIKIFITIIMIPIIVTSNSDISDLEHDKCGFDKNLAMAQLQMLGDHWGYAYADLLDDLQNWSKSPYITIDSIGASVQNRAIWQLTLVSDQPPEKLRQTVFIHARTHPGEVQSWWVTDEIIELLSSESELARYMRDQCTFYILPMYNPDGVELEYPRENANRIDIESNWNKNPTEPEVTVLRNRFETLMASESPIKVALNMHSAYACRRYFVYHHENGTSLLFSQLEKDFIHDIRQHFISGIEPWDYFISWKNGTPTQYPESWFWMNYQEAVMALTYEDMNCSAADDYDKTAFALMHGVADYLGLVTTVDFSSDSRSPRQYQLMQNYPNPVHTNEATVIQYHLDHAQEVELVLYDILGRPLRILDKGWKNATDHRIFLTLDQLSAGTYFYRLRTGSRSYVKKLTIIR